MLLMANLVIKRSECSDAKDCMAMSTVTHLLAIALWFAMSDYAVEARPGPHYAPSVSPLLLEPHAQAYSCVLFDRGEFHTISS